MDLPALQQVSENVEPIKKRRIRRRWKDGNFGKISKRKRMAARLKKLMEAASKARERRPPHVCASRAVELVNQKGEAWRESTPKSLFMRALGLTINPSSERDTQEVRCLVELQSCSSTVQRTMRYSGSSLHRNLKNEERGPQKETIPDSETETIDLSLDDQGTEWEDGSGSEMSPIAVSCDPKINSLGDHGKNIQEPSGIAELPIPTTKPYPHPVFNEFLALLKRIHAREKTYEQMGQLQSTVNLPIVSPLRQTPAESDDDDIIILN